MDDNHETFPSLPSNYITIVDLQKRWLEQQQQQQQQQQQNNKQLAQEFFKSDKPEELNKNTLISNPNSHIQKKAVQLNPTFKPRNPFRNNFNDKKPSQSIVKEVQEPKVEGEANINKNTRVPNSNSQFQKSTQLNPYFKPRKPFHNDFNGKEPSQSNAADFVVVDSEVENSKVEGENKRKKKKKKKKNKMRNGDDDQVKGEVIDDDQTVEIEPNFKKDMAMAAIEPPKRVYGGYRRFNRRELRAKETNQVCVEKRENVGEEKGETMGAVREEIQLHGRESKVSAEKENAGEVKGKTRGVVREGTQMHGRESKLENKVKSVSAERENAGEVKGKTRGVVREGTQFHGRESKLENKVSAEKENVGEEKGETRGVVVEEIQLHGREFKVEDKVSAEETDNKGEVIVENQTVEIESKLTRVSVSGKYWRPRAAIKGSKVGYNDYRRVPHRGRGFYMKNRQYEQKSFRPVRYRSKLQGGIGRAENKEIDNKDQMVEQSSELEANEARGEVGGLENGVCVEKAGNQGDLNVRNDDPNGGNGRVKIEQNSGHEAREVHWELGGLENVVCALKADNQGEVKGGIDDPSSKSMAVNVMHRGFRRFDKRDVRNEWGARGEPWRRFGYGRSNAAMGHSSWNGGNMKRELVWVKRVDLNDKS